MAAKPTGATAPSHALVACATVNVLPAVHAQAKPGHGYWCRTRTAKRWDGSSHVVGPFAFGCSFHRFDHADQAGFSGPVAIIVTENERLAVDGCFPFVGANDATLSGWIRRDGYAKDGAA